MTDPAASWTAAPGGPAFFAYSTNYLVDLQAGIIVDVEASAVNKSAEVETTKTMMNRVEDKFDLKPERFVGDRPDVYIRDASGTCWRVLASDGGPTY